MSITFITSTFNPSTVIQKNALYSWQRAGIPFIVVGDAPFSDVKEFKRESDLGFSGDSPIITDMVAKALPRVNTDMVGLINADVLIEPDFPEMVERILNKYGADIFLTSVRRDTSWEGEILNDGDLKKALISPWTSHQDGSADLFISSRERFESFSREFPEFILGRLAWDNAVHVYFLKQNMSCLNSSEYLKIYHQKHGYEHFLDKDFLTIQRNPGAHPSTNYNCHLFGAFMNKMGGPIPRVKTAFSRIEL